MNVPTLGLVAAVGALVEPLNLRFYLELIEFIYLWK
jgi:hypothetical protein